MAKINRLAFFKKRIPLYRKSIELFATEVIGFRPDEWQSEVFVSIAENRYTAVKSGQGVGKTGTEAAVVLWFLTCFPYPRVVCTAPTKQQLHDVLWSEISKWQSKSPILADILRWTKTYIYMVGYEKRWFAVARTATKPENMQGFHEDNMLFVVDEASGVADPIMEAILGTLSGENNKLLLCGNPTKTSGAFYDAFHSSRAIYSCHTVNSEDSPRTNKQNIKLLEKKYGRDSNVFRVRVLGEFPVQEDDVFIPLSLVEQAIMLDPDEEVPSISIGVDVARYGDDETIIVSKAGMTCTIEGIRTGQSTMRTVGDIVITYNALLKRYPDYKGIVNVVIDDTGVGGGVTDRLAEVKAESKLYQMSITPINFASKPPVVDGEYYSDMTTFLWGRVRNLLESRALCLPNDNELVAQLSVRKYSLNSKGLIKLESKDDMKERGIKSPDRADALSLACYSTEKVYQWDEKAASLVITKTAVRALPISEIIMGVSSAGFFGVSITATAIIGDCNKAVVLGVKVMEGHAETDSVGAAFAEFATRIRTEYGRLDYCYCDPDDTLMVKGLRVAASNSNVSVIIRTSQGKPIEDRIKLTTRLIAQTRLFLTGDCRELEQALSMTAWSGKKTAVARAEDSNASILNSFEYTLERYISRFVVREYDGG